MMDCGFPAGLVFVVFGLAVEAGMSSTATGIVDVVPLLHAKGDDLKTWKRVIAI
jgi:hypothetical protein